MYWNTTKTNMQASKEHKKWAEGLKHSEISQHKKKQGNQKDQGKKQQGKTKTPRKKKPRKTKKSKEKPQIYQGKYPDTKKQGNKKIKEWKIRVQHSGAFSNLGSNRGAFEKEKTKGQQLKGNIVS